MNATKILDRTDSHSKAPLALADAASLDQKRKVIVRSHSKVIYFYPTVLAGLICSSQVPVEGGGMWGDLFLAVFFANLLVVVFEFNSLKVLFLSLVSLVVALALWCFGLVSFVTEHLAQVHFSMNRQGYFLFAGFLGLLITGDAIWAHLNRWEFSANDVKHIQLFTGQTANFPGRGLRFQLHTVDVWERLLLGSGTLLLSLGGKKVQIQNVPFVKGKVKDLEKFVRSAGIFNDEQDVFDDPGEFEED